MDERLARLANRIETSTPECVLPRLELLTPAQREDEIRRHTKEVLALGVDFHASRRPSTGHEGTEHDRVGALLDDAQLAWAGVFAQRIGPGVLSRLKEEVGFASKPLSRDPRLGACFDSLISKLQETRSATDVWRTRQRFPRDEVVCFSHQPAPPDQRARLAALNIPRELKALYAETNGLQVYLGPNPGGRGAWRSDVDPQILPPRQVRYNPDTGFFLFGISYQCHLGLQAASGQVHLLPMRAPTRELHGATRMVGVDLPSALEWLGAARGYLEPLF